MKLNFAFSEKPAIQTHSESPDQPVALEKDLGQTKPNSTNPKSSPPKWQPEYD